MAVVFALVGLAVWWFVFNKKPASVAVAGVAVRFETSPASPSLQVGDSVQMRVVYRDSANRQVEDTRTITWSSDNPAVAVISGAWVKAVGGGSATLIAELEAFAGQR